MSPNLITLLNLTDCAKSASGYESSVDGRKTWTKSGVKKIPEESGSGGSCFRCGECDRKFDTKNLLEIHLDEGIDGRLSLNIRICVSSCQSSNRS